MFDNIFAGNLQDIAGLVIIWTVGLLMYSHLTADAKKYRMAYIAFLILISIIVVIVF